MKMKTVLKKIEKSKETVDKLENLKSFYSNKNGTLLGKFAYFTDDEMVINLQSVSVTLSSLKEMLMHFEELS